MAWCVAGAMDYLANGLRVPPKVADASETAGRRLERLVPFPSIFRA
jgi:hypothetical protein